MIKSSAFKRGAVYSAFIIAFVIFGVALSFALKSFGDYYVAAAQLPVAAAFAAAMVLAFYFGIKEVGDFGLKKPKATDFLFALLLLFGTLTGLSQLNSLFTDAIGYNGGSVTLPEFSVGGYILLIVTVCALPAFIEEVIFRGVVVSGLKGANAFAAALVSGILFSLYHMNPAQTPYQLVVGFFYALLAIKSGSVFPSAAAHFLNNFIIITLNYFAPSDLFGGAAPFLTAAGLAAIAAFTVLTVIGILKSRKKEKTESKEEKSSGGGFIKFIFGASAGAVVCAFVWIANLIGGL